MLDSKRSRIEEYSDDSRATVDMPLVKRSHGESDQYVPSTFQNTSAEAVTNPLEIKELL